MYVCIHEYVPILVTERSQPGDGNDIRSVECWVGLVLIRESRCEVGIDDGIVGFGFGIFTFFFTVIRFQLFSSMSCFNFGIDPIPNAFIRQV